jgi:serine/threonine protein phosphatase 1
MPKKWIIPDLHGHSKTLKALVEEQIRPSRHDLIFFLGDYIDRGPDSKGVIDYIIKLQKDDYTIRLLRGNHEDYLLRTYDNEVVTKSILGITVHQNKLKQEWYKYGGKDTLKSFNITEVHQIPESYIEWMRKLEYYITLDQFILVHAGLNFGLKNPFSDIDSMMWIKDFKVDLSKTDSRKVIHGHVPVSLEFIEALTSSNGYNFIDLDNGLYMSGKSGFGNLVALELTSMELKVQLNLDTP